MSHIYIKVKKKKENPGDLMFSQVSIYGDEMDFFFLIASMTRMNDPSVKNKARKDPDLARLKPEKI